MEPHHLMVQLLLFFVVAVSAVPIHSIAQDGTLQPRLMKRSAFITEVPSVSKLPSSFVSKPKPLPPSSTISTPKPPPPTSRISATKPTPPPLVRQTSKSLLLAPKKAEGLAIVSAAPATVQLSNQFAVPSRTPIFATPAADSLRQSMTKMSEDRKHQVVEQAKEKGDEKGAARRASAMPSPSSLSEKHEGGLNEKHDSAEPPVATGNIVTHEMNEERKQKPGGPIEQLGNDTDHQANTRMAVASVAKSGVKLIDTAVKPALNAIPLPIGKGMVNASLSCARGSLAVMAACAEGPKGNGTGSMMTPAFHMITSNAVGELKRVEDQGRWIKFGQQDELQNTLSPISKNFGDYVHAMIDGKKAVWTAQGVTVGA